MIISDIGHHKYFLKYYQYILLKVSHLSFLIKCNGISKSFRPFFPHIVPYVHVYVHVYVFRIGCNRKLAVQ